MHSCGIKLNPKGGMLILHLVFGSKEYPLPDILPSLASIFLPLFLMN